MTQRIKALFLLFTLVWLMGADWRAMLSPGHLSKAHADIAGQCDKCHAVFAGIPDARCLECHEPIATRIASGEGYHASVGEQACIECHGDHGGPDGPTTKPEVTAAFDHAKTGFALGGRHRRLDCEECHTRPLDDMSGACMTCHNESDPHQSALGPECEACHVDAGWDVQLKTLGAHFVDTTGGHADLGCSDCHLYGAHLTPYTKCADCHERGHGGTTADCAQCHQVSGFKPASFDHGPCGCSFPGKHQTVSCLSCHEEFRFTDTPSLCSGCHEADRPHEPLGECSQCHTALSWSEGRFDHSRSAFALDGAHLAVSCDQCHAEKFRGVPTTCQGCHGPAGDEAHGDFGACEPCHTTAGFKPSQFDHASVSFPLVGRHSTLPCQECHATQVAGYPKVP